MGLKSTRPGGVIRKDDVSIAKNYLDDEELQTLNRIVNAYLAFQIIWKLFHSRWNLSREPSRPLSGHRGEPAWQRPALEFQMATTS